MKSIFFSLGAITLTFLTLLSCEKNEIQPQASKNAKEAEFRLGSVKKWVIIDVSLNGIYIMKNKVLLDPEQDGMAEWLIFDTDDKTVEVKYPMEAETTFFDYSIENDVFRVKHKDGTEEVMTIRSGSVFVDHFTLEQSDEFDKFEVLLKPE